MTFEELVAKLRKDYPGESKFIPDDVDFLEYVEHRIQHLIGADDLLPAEQEKLNLLPLIREFLQ